MEENIQSRLDADHTASRERMGLIVAVLSVLVTLVCVMVGGWVYTKEQIAVLATNQESLIETMREIKASNISSQSNTVRLDQNQIEISKVQERGDKLYDLIIELRQDQIKDRAIQKQYITTMTDLKNVIATLDATMKSMQREMRRETQKNRDRILKLEHLNEIDG